MRARRRNPGRVDQPLDMDVGDRFLLQFAFLRLQREVVGECDIDTGCVS